MGRASLFGLSLKSLHKEHVWAYVLGLCIYCFRPHQCHFSFFLVFYELTLAQRVVYNNLLLQLQIVSIGVFILLLLVPSGFIAHQNHSKKISIWLHSQVPDFSYFRSQPKPKSKVQSRGIGCRLERSRDISVAVY